MTREITITIPADHPLAAAFATCSDAEAVALLTGDALITNELGDAWTALCDARGPGQHLAALASMAEVCPEIIDWLITATGQSDSQVRHALALVDQPGGLEESEIASAEDPDLDALLDAARMFGTIGDALDSLEDEDPKAVAVIRAQYGIGVPETTLVALADEREVSRETVRKWGVRGRNKLRARLSAHMETT